MTNERDFNSGVLRIAIIQILRSVGFYRTSNRLVDILCDLYIRFFQLLLEKTQRNNQLRAPEDDISVQDLALAIEDLGLVRPSNPLDPYDLDPVNDTYNQLWKDWIFGDYPELSRETSKPNLAYLKSQRIKSLRLKLAKLGITMNNNVNSNFSTGGNFAFSTRTKEEIELEKLLNDELQFNVPFDFFQYLLTELDPALKSKLSNTSITDQLIDRYTNFDPDQPPVDVPDQQQETEDQDTKAQQLPDYHVQGPTPPNLQDYLPYNDKTEIPDFDLNKYFQAEKLQQYKIDNNIELKDELDPNSDGSGLKLGW